MTTGRLVVIIGVIGLLGLGASFYIVSNRYDTNGFSRKQGSEGGRIANAARSLDREVGATAPPLPSQTRPSEPATVSPKQSSEHAASQVEDVSLTPRTVTTSRIVKSDDPSRVTEENKSPVTAHDRPPNHADVSNTPAITDRATALPSHDEVLMVKRSRANIRATPSRTGPIVGTAAKGSKVTVLNRSGNWIEVDAGDVKGWISSGLLSKPLAQ